jgi:uncharacterized membrane protein
MNNAFYFIIILCVAGSVSVGYFSLLCLANRNFFAMFISIVCLSIDIYMCISMSWKTPTKIIWFGHLYLS